LPKKLEGVFHQVMRVNPQLARRTGIFKLVNKLFIKYKDNYISVVHLIEQIVNKEKIRNAFMKENCIGRVFGEITETIHFKSIKLFLEKKSDLEAMLNNQWNKQLESDEFQKKVKKLKDA